LKEEVATIQKELADLASSQAEMDKVRASEKELFAENKPELEAGIQAVQSGTKILKEQYGAGSDAINSVLGFLEVVESDFSKSLVETVAAEETAQSEYERLSKENQITKTAKDKDVEYKNKEMATLAKDISSATADREGVQTELDSVLEYLAELQKTCVAKPETYKDRAARRAAEIAGLKEALEILGSEAGFVQQGSLRGVNRHSHARGATASGTGRGEVGPKDRVVDMPTTVEFDGGPERDSCRDVAGSDCSSGKEPVKVVHTSAITPPASWRVRVFRAAMPAQASRKIRASPKSSYPLEKLLAFWI